jgi:hypothetical protein
MKVRFVCVVLGATILSACGESGSPTFTPSQLVVSINPNPLSAPSAPGVDLTFDVALQVVGSGSFLILGAEARLVDAALAEVGRTNEFWSRASGCATCSTDVRLKGNDRVTFGGKRVRFVGGASPVRLLYTVSYEDSFGSGTATTEVAVR